MGMASVVRSGTDKFASQGQRRLTGPTCRGMSSGSGSARLGLSQKGALPSSGERQFSFGPRSPTRAKPNGERPRGGVASPGPPTSLGPGGLSFPQRDAVSHPVRSGGFQKQRP
jgi:hypothetical protein